MADRVTVDIEGLRERIDEAYSDNPLWSELSLAQKLRRLILDGLEKAEGDRALKLPAQPATKSRKSNKPA
ncbi:MULTISPECIES: hypothetical protein [Trichocoleus]|uniref:Uncharacterized protein n=1 Tax=Trichocoleus desertorum GB2-A4 TaxID=2933944 RepID=A0ABV0JGM0_9CYAN|nr:hypothetical protein [Trichocoleus sp. FACHB-46]MBD1865268.1 hypothetical protein [Trichocoleus sp. FACHB-46]